MKIDLFLVRHPADRPSPVMPAMVDHLTAHGSEIRAVYPDEGDAVPDPPGDLVVLKAKTPAALDLARRYHGLGVRCFPSYEVTVLCRDKIATTLALRDAGVPVPQTWVVDDPGALLPHLTDGPLIVKPFQGSQGQGIVIVHQPEDLVGIDHGADPVMAQRYLEPDGLDRKIYRIGEEVFCVERVWPPRSYEDKLGRVVPLPAAIEKVARACGDALGIDTYGVDIIEHRGAPYVVDLSSFPGFKGVPEAGRRLAERIQREGQVSDPA
ncbi:ATP-grasp domain-containing protein [Ornithinimicrobium sp. Y1694]|uniref:ATP-grasp domain-containing protein n=1 Tax=Ornithinimicrobium sp. Y1694 TaxID=3418590 RepID=UPI003CF6BD66